MKQTSSEETWLRQTLKGAGGAFVLLLLDQKTFIFPDQHKKKADAKKASAFVSFPGLSAFIDVKNGDEEWLDDTKTTHPYGHLISLRFLCTHLAACGHPAFFDRIIF